MKNKLPLIARLMLGFVFFGAGLFGLIKGMQPVPDMPEAMQSFIKGMAASTYFFPFLKTAEMVCGLLLLSGMYVPLALVVLAPIILNITLVHAFMAPNGLPLAVILGTLEVYLAFFATPYRDVIRPLFLKRPSTR